MNGYLMIEKEIELIESRLDTDAFTGNLIKLQNKELSILNDKSVDRVKTLIKDTPIYNDFIAANLNYKITEFIPLNINLYILLIISTIVGLLVSFSYISISYILKKNSI